MKKFLSFLLLILIYKFSFCQDTKYSIGAGVGFGLYGGKSNDKNAQDTTAIDAACGIIQIHADYDIVKRFALGFKFERNGFLSAKDSSEKASSLNLGISGKFKFVSKEKNFLYLDINPSYSYFTYEKKEVNKTNKVFSDGFNFQLGLGWDHYFGKRIGMFISSYYTLYKYNKIINKDDNTILKVNYRNYPQENYRIKFSGLNLNAGLIVRF